MSNNKKSINPDDPSYLIVTRSGERPRTVPLEPGSSLFVGSGSNCRLVLKDEQVKQIHCMLLLDKVKRLKVQDWNTGQLMLNGKPVELEADVREGDRIGVGSYQIVPVLSSQFHRGTAAQILERNGVNLEELLQDNQTAVAETPPADAELQRPIDTCPEQSLAPPDYGVMESSEETEFDSQIHPQPATSANALSEDTEATFEVDANGTGFEYDLDADLRDDFDEDFDTSDLFGDSLASSLAEDDELGEDVEMLKMEVEQLRYELADRSNQLRLLQQQQAEKTSDRDDSETLKLVERLEELLEELQFSDERVRSLEELLRLSDQATQAEQEERRQLESWVGEIENRVEQHDAETRAEVERLTEQLTESRKRTKFAEVQFKKLLASQDAQTESDANGHSDALRQSHQQIAELQQQLQQLQDENDRLREQPVASNDDAQAREENHALKQQLAQLQVESARDKAEMARRHAELERMRDELEEKVNSVRQINAGDTRIKAMREHLREIHEQERQEREQNRQASLGGRIANLLTRLK